MRNMFRLVVSLFVALFSYCGRVRSRASCLTRVSLKPLYVVELLPWLQEQEQGEISLLRQRECL
jgi:hypothetical protein